MFFFHCGKMLLSSRFATIKLSDKSVVLAFPQEKQTIISKNIIVFIFIHSLIKSVSKMGVNAFTTLSQTQLTLTRPLVYFQTYMN